MKKNYLFLILLFFSIGILYRCAAGSYSVKNISTTEAEKMVNTKKNIVIIDVRTAEEYATGHLPGAINIDVLSPNFETKTDSLNRNNSYLVYCRSGHRSSNAIIKMKQNNFLHLLNMKGGIQAWSGTLTR